MNPTYQNPVYPHECADPFVLKYKGEYYCYRTGGWKDGRMFAILRSPDLLHWEEVGGAIEPLPGIEHYWAPEVYYANGRFHMVYAVGQGDLFHLRLALSAQPGGPFTDTGRKLTRQPFAIDGDVFEDEDGRRFLFYATDFLDHSRVGTGTVMDEITSLEPFTLAGKPRPVSRACFDWQIFDPQRAEKGGVRWHTIEGSFVLKHKGLYYQMFSGGNFQNPSYGVGYALTSTIDRQAEWDQPIDGVSQMPVLRTIPGKVNGPGHNSVVRGPDNRQLFCVYHVIKPAAHFERVMAIDPLNWVGRELKVIGPSSNPVPAPIQALRLCQPQKTLGQVDITPRGDLTFQAGPGPAQAYFSTGSPSFLFETSLAFSGAGQAALRLSAGDQTRLHFYLDCSQTPPRAAAVVDEELVSAWVELPLGFDPRSVHLLRLDVDGLRCSLSLDHSTFRWQGVLSAPAETLVLEAAQGGLQFCANDLTRGFEDLFEPGSGTLNERGWVISNPHAAAVAEGNLRLQPASGETLRLERAYSFRNYELLLNLALHPDGCCEVLFSSSRLRITPDAITWLTPQGAHPLDTAPMPAGQFQHVRARKQDEQILLFQGERSLGVYDVDPAALPLQLAVAGGLDLDMVSLTEIPS